MQRAVAVLGVVVAVSAVAGAARVTGVGLVDTRNYVHVGDASASLFCAYELEADEHEAASITWLKAGLELQTSDDSGSSKSSLTLQHLKRSHNGYYTCKISFPEDESLAGDQMQYELLVKDKPVDGISTEHHIYGNTEGEIFFTVNRTASYPPEFAFCGLIDVQGHWIQGPEDEETPTLSFSSLRGDWEEEEDEDGTAFSLTNRKILLSDIPTEQQGGPLLAKCEWRALTLEGKEPRDYMLSFTDDVYAHYRCPPEPLRTGDVREDISVVYGGHSVEEDGWWSSFHDMASEMVCDESLASYVVKCSKEGVWHHEGKETQKADINEFVDTCAQCRIAPLSLLVAVCALLAAATN